MVVLFCVTTLIIYASISDTNTHSPKSFKRYTTSSSKESKEAIPLFTKDSPNRTGVTIPALEDYVHYPCVPGLPRFSPKGQRSTGQCVRMFNDTERDSHPTAECVTLKYIMRTVTICTFDLERDQVISKFIHVKGMWEGRLVNSIARFLMENPDVEFLDLGCNIGVYTLVAAHIGRKVVAVDPLVENLELLSKSLSLGQLHDKVTLIWNAISDQYSKVTLTDHAGNMGGKAIRNLTDEDNGNADLTIVHTIRLDDLIPLFRGKRVVLKMDIETKEYDALLGGVLFFDSIDIPLIQLEINWHKNKASGLKIFEFLSSRNYQGLIDYNYKEPLEISKISSWPPDIYFVKL